MLNFFNLLSSIWLILFNSFAKHFIQALLYGIIVCPIKELCKLYPPPIIWGIFLSIQNSPTHNEVVSTFGLSAQLITKSTLLSIYSYNTFSSRNLFIFFTLMSLLKLFNLFSSASVFNNPISSSLNPNCLFKFVSSTTSLSINIKLWIPDCNNVDATQVPTPPNPIMTTVDDFKLFHILTICS